MIIIHQNNASNQFDDIFPPENITVNNTPFPYHRLPIDDNFPFDPHFDFRHGYHDHREFTKLEENLSEVKTYSENVSLSSNTYYVPDDYEKIQWAVDNASAGDTIIIRDGTYTENVIVNKPHLTIHSENGSEATIIQVMIIHWAGVGFEIYSDYVNISGLTITGAGDLYSSIGINLTSNHCNLSNNNCSEHSCGISLRGNYNSISGNILSNNQLGIGLGDSAYNNVSENICISNDHGIDIIEGINIVDSANNKLKGNNMVDCGILIGGDSVTDYMQVIDESNTVNGKPVYYWKNVEGEKAPEGAGEVILVNCTSIVVENQNAYIELAFSSNITMKKNEGIVWLVYSNGNNCYANNLSLIVLSMSDHNNVSGNNCSGIYLSSFSTYNNISLNNCSIISLDYFSSNNNITGNTISNGWINIDTSDNTISKNDISFCMEGISLQDPSSNNLIMDNNIQKCNVGIMVRTSADNNVISDNNISNNGAGIALFYSRENIIKGNTFVNDGLVVSSSSYENTVENNIVNGKPLIYLEDASDREIGDAGQVILINCNNITVNGLDLSYTGVGITLFNGNNCIISNNKMTNNNFYGIFIVSSTDSTILSNTIISNKHSGLLIFYSMNSTISVNTISSNSHYGVYIEDSSSNTLLDNNVSNHLLGIEINSSIDSTISSNTIFNDSLGIYLRSSNRNTISNNTISSNDFLGLRGCPSIHYQQ